MRRLFAVACALVGACGDAHTGVATDASADAVADVVEDVDAAPEGEAEAGATLVSISTSPPMSPVFSLDVYDYAIRCKNAHNPVTVTVTTTASSVSTDEDFVPNEDYVAAGAYHIRCL